MLWGTKKRLDSNSEAGEQPCHRQKLIDIRRSEEQKPVIYCLSDVVHIKFHLNLACLRK